MADDEQQSDGEDGARQIDEITVAQLKEELKGRKLKVSGNKVDLVARLKAALVLEDQHEEGSDNDESSDESEDEHDEAGANGNEGNRARNRSKFVPTFKDIEESIDNFSGDDGKDVKLWIKKSSKTWRNCANGIRCRKLYMRRDYYEALRDCS